MASNPSEIEQNINLADSKHLAILKQILNLFLFLPENNASAHLSFSTRKQRICASISPHLPKNDNKIHI